MARLTGQVSLAPEIEAAFIMPLSELLESINPKNSMNRLPEKINYKLLKHVKVEVVTPATKVDMVAKGVATGIVASTIIQTGRGIAGTLARNPLVMFGVGIAVGYFARKYRKEVISVTRYTAGQTRETASRGKKNI
ncbi:MAG: hypothetical protein ACU841_08570 [Gammaproteobacteria bacterium]